MDGVLQNVTGFAIWGSFAATLTLGCFLAAQAAVDRPRRAPYALFAAAMGGLAALDLLRIFGRIEPTAYEVGRLLWCGAHAGALLALFGHPLRRALAAAVALPALGLAVFQWKPELATTVAISLGYGLAAVAHGLEYRRTRGYASALLAAYMAATALMCSLYLAVIATRDPLAMILGYAHYAEASIVAVLLGWIHLPRELHGRSPVRMEARPARALFLGVLGLELALQVGLFVGRGSFPYLYLGALLAQLAWTLAFYFRHRNQLVVYAENVGQLLAEARAELARQNDILAERLAAQERELRAKGEVIERQRRLELAAQTAGQVAHDIQNLVSPVLSRLESVQDAGSLAELREATRIARTQVNDVLELNTQLLALSRRGRAEPLPVPLDDLLRDVAQRFPGRPLQVDVEGRPWTRGSWGQLARAISNLVSNALESGHDPASPVLLRASVQDLAHTRPGRIGFLSPGRWARVEVVDRGRGIPAADLDRIFEPFFSSKRAGSGLGLCVVAAVVDDHKGALDLDTGPEGTRVRLHFPAIEPAEESPLSCSATALVVDDDPATLRECSELLPAYGWTVLTASGGAEALRTLQAREVDVILLDIQMPGMDGLEAYLGAMHVRPGTRAVAHSAHLSDEQERRLRAWGVETVLRKPAGRDAILRALRDAVRR